MRKVKTRYYFIHLLNDFSGSPRVLRDMVDSTGFSKSGKYIITSRQSGFLTGVDATYLKICYRPYQSRLLKLISFMWAQLCLFAVTSVILIMAKIRRINSIVVINTLLPFGAAIPARVLSDAVIYYVHETTVNPPKIKPLLRYFVEQCADHVIFVSRYLHERECFRRPVQHVIHNGLRGDFVQDIRIDEVNKFSNRSVLFVGSLKAYKGIFQLLEIARLAPTLNFVGLLNCPNDEFTSFAKRSEFPLPGNLQVITNRDNIQRYFQEAFVVLNLSVPDLHVETFALTLLEGMSFGCAVVAPPVGGHTDYVSSEHGLLIDSREVRLIAEYLEVLASSYTTWVQCSRASATTAKRFSQESYRRQIGRLLCSIEGNFQ